MRGETAPDVRPQQFRRSHQMCADGSLLRMVGDKVRKPFRVRRDDEDAAVEAIIDERPSDSSYCPYNCFSRAATGRFHASRLLSRHRFGPKDATICECASRARGGLKVTRSTLACCAQGSRRSNITVRLHNPRTDHCRTSRNCHVVAARRRRHARSPATAESQRSARSRVSCCRAHSNVGGIPLGTDTRRSSGSLT